MPDWARATPGGTRIDLRVVPRSRQNGIEGLRDNRLLVRVTAPPVDRAANDAVIALLSSALAVPRRAIRVVSGETNRNKTVEVAGMALDGAIARLRQSFTQ